MVKRYSYRVVVKKRYFVLALLTLLGAITFLDRLVIATAGPRIMDDLGISPEQWGWILGSFILSYGLFQIPLGVLGDKYGTKIVLGLIVIWWSVFTGLTGVAIGFTSLLIFRFLFGIGEAGAYPLMSSSISKWFPSSERGMAQGFIWGASRAGGAIAPLLVVPIQLAYGWRASFFFLSILGLVWGIIWWFFYRNKPSEHPSITDSELKEIDYVETKNEKILVPWKIILKKPQFWMILAMYWFYVWGSWFYFAWLHTYLIRGRGFSEEEMVYASASPFVLGMIANIVGGFLSDFLSKKYGTYIGRSVLGASSLLVSAFLLAAAGLAETKFFIAAFLALSFGVMDLMLPAAWALCLDVGGKFSGAITGAMNTAGNLGGFVCTVLFGYLVTIFDSYNAPIYVIACMLIISSIIFFRINPKHSLVEEN